MCGLGEASTAHLFSWCPAVGLVWHILRPHDAPWSLGDALLTDCGHQALLAQLVHQITYLYSISLGLTPIGADEAARRIMAGMVSSSDDTPDLQDDTGLLYRPADVTGTWHPWEGPCRHCGNSASRRRVVGSAHPAQTRTGERGGGAMRRCPVTSEGVQAGDLLLRLQGPEATNGWLLACPGWVPPPRVDPLEANARWQVTYCPNCDMHIASLYATLPLRPQQEVICRTAPFPDVDTIRYPYEVTFDGLSLIHI